MGAVILVLHFIYPISRSKYTNNKVTYDIFNNAVDDSDVVYSNVINDNNVTEMDDIELLINSNAKNISSYSNCATKSGDKFDYLKKRYIVRCTIKSIAGTNTNRQVLYAL